MPPTEASPDDLRVLLGGKLRTLRTAARRSLKDVAARAGVSISYLSEIEQGKKYPKPERLVRLAQALGADYDALVSLQPAPGTATPGPADLPARAPLASGGREPSEDCAEALRTLTVGRDPAAVRWEALDAYRTAHRNHFPDAEQAAEAFRAHTSLPDSPPALVPRLRRHLADHYGYTFDETTLARHPVLSRLRSVLVTPADAPTRFYVNSLLGPGQRAFLLAREVAFNRLRLTPRTTTSPARPDDAFEALRHTLHASAFAGALVLPGARMRATTEGLLGMDRWRDEAFLGSIRAFGVTPELYFHRLAGFLPAAFGFSGVLLTRATTRAAEADAAPVVNLSGRPLAPPPGEHACRRWGASALLREGPPVGAEYAARALVVRFVGPEGEAEPYFTVTVARPLMLDRTHRAAVTLGVRLDDRFAEAARFARDPSVPSVEAGLSCERCPVRGCPVREAAPVRLAAEAEQAEEAAALAALVEGRA